METEVQLNKYVPILGLNIPIEVYEFFKTAGKVLIICTFFYLFIATPNQVEGDSMAPILNSGELIITDKIDNFLVNVSSNLGTGYQRGDIVVFQKPKYKDFVKRIVGLPGEKISIKNGHVFVNEIELKEDYVLEHTTLGGDFLSSEGPEILIPEDRYLVLGDNRIDSLDSRYNDIGLINKAWIKGRVILKYWPLSSFTIFKRPIYNI